MRKLRFRAWEIDEKRWLDKDELFISVFDGSVTGWQKDANWILMQCTGLKDKDGNEIFEGDIVRSQFPYNATFLVNTDLVVWHIETAGFMLGPRMLNDKLILEVIGNIYENPELLSVDNSPVQK